MDGGGHGLPALRTWAPRRPPDQSDLAQRESPSFLLILPFKPVPKYSPDRVGMKLIIISSLSGHGVSEIRIQSLGDRRYPHPAVPDGKRVALCLVLSSSSGGTSSWECTPWGCPVPCQSGTVVPFFTRKEWLQRTGFKLGL